jgi:hypothetical protein
MIFNRNFLYVLCVLSASANMIKGEFAQRKKSTDSVQEALLDAGQQHLEKSSTVDSRHNGSNDALANDYNITVNGPWGG